MAQTVKEAAKGMMDSLDDNDAMLTIAYMRSLGGKQYTDAEATISALDELCSNGARLWTQDPQEYVQGLRDEDRI